jgi:phage terminase large subunit-like protein
VRAAAKRHLADLKRKRFPYQFVPDKGARVCRFIEMLPHTKGQWAAKKQTIKLEPWQCFLVVVLFGWLRRSNGKRRFRAAYWEIPRKNGKSILAAGMGLYMLLADGEFGAEVYSGATTEKPAWEVFKPAKLMLQRNERMREKLGASVWAKALVVESNGSKFEPIIGDPGDGASPSCAIVDEYHEHQTPNLHDTMETGMGAREHPCSPSVFRGRGVAAVDQRKWNSMCADKPPGGAVLFAASDTVHWFTARMCRGVDTGSAPPHSSRPGSHATSR